ncbi:predicted protein [Naegleria gruberi]|uniref:Predicted protein n=1 Tax=Naegleria gruberi TaxID=5762 RepID=D2V1L2_NAEGR|nr:uncharacterized protein NAEGRDRAFT_30358 [Naegleria gruberi]EFC49181.1 predicted protein [Naegleria gruberi]|eukprot:XP_002681925.1 predicted protein [Naegleria gruberi strain NEG-M]
MSQTITKTQVQSLLGNLPTDLVLLDVREHSEYTSTDLPAIHNSAINVPVATVKNVFELSDEEFEKQVGKKKPSKNDQIVTYCKLGGRAQKAADQLVELGYTNVHCFKGSASEWYSN